MIAPGNGSHRYEVHCSGVIAESLRQLHREATEQGRGPAVTEAFRQVILRLERDPY